MTQALRELLAVFGVNIEDEKLKAFDKSVESTVGRVKLAARVIGEAFIFREVAEFFAGPIEAGARIADLSSRLGIAAHDLQAWQFAARLAGVDSEQAAHSLGLLNRTIGQAAAGIGGQGGEAFAKLGVHLKDASGQVRPVLDILGDVSDGFAKLPNQQERAAYSMKLFGREGQALLPILAGGREELEKNFAEFRALGGGMGDDFVRDAKRADDEMVKVKFGLNALRVSIVNVALPGIEKIIDGFLEWVKRVQEFNRTSYAMTTGLEFLGVVAGVKLAGSIRTLLKSVGLLKPSFLETVVALGKFAIPLAVVAALYLIFDDFYTMMRGGKSIIGDVLDALFGFGTAAKVVRQINVDVKELEGSMSLLAASAWKLPDAFSEIGTVIKDVLLPILTLLNDTIGGIYMAVGNLLALNPSGARSALSGAGQHSAGVIGSSVVEAGNAVTDMVFGKGDKGHANAKAVAGTAPSRAPGGVDATAPAAPTSAWTDASGIGSLLQAIRGSNAPAQPPLVVNQQNTTKVDVHTSSDAPAAVGAAVGNGVSTSQRKANANAMAAVRRR